MFKIREHWFLFHMQIKPPEKRSRKFLRVSLIIIGIFAVLGFGFHIWFVNNARSFIKGIIASKSKGTLKLELSSISFNFLTNKFKIREAVLISTDSVATGTSYRVKFSKLTVNAGSLWSLLSRKSLDLDSIKLHNPEVVITQLSENAFLTTAKNELSVSQQMGKLYNSMLDGFDAFGIRRIIINDAAITLIDKTKPWAEPVTISNIYFNMVNTAKGEDQRDKFIENKQSVDLVTNDQNIALPGGRHRIAFKKFNLRLFNKRIELDSCTITAIATDSLQSSYTVFFDKLLLVGVDFNAMYRLNLIKADSVYCENPLFDISINSLAGGAKKEKPDPEKIIRDLTGDLDLAFVGVKDAGIHINITGKKKRALFNSNKDDFEIRGFRVNGDSSAPVVVDRFDMLVRDYHLYNEDSSSSYTFDSIHFLNNRIVLNNFSVVTYANPGGSQSERNFKIPYFALTGLDWYQLIFEETLVANEALLLNPVINYIRRTTATRRKKTNIFQSLKTLDDLITLKKLSVINGQIDLTLGPATSFRLKDANLILYSERLQPGNTLGMRSAIEKLSASNSFFRFNDITAEIQNLRYTGTALIHADKVLITEKTGNTKAVVNDVYINNVIADDNSETVIIDGLKWSSAKLQIRTVPGQRKKTASRNGNISLTNLSGNNSELFFSNGSETVTGYVESLSIASLQKQGSGALQVNKLRVKGNSLSVKAPSASLKASSYLFASEAPSFLSDLEILQIKQQDTLSVKSEHVDFRMDINAMINKDIHLSNLEAVRPVIKIAKWSIDSSGAVKSGNLRVRIDRVVAREADILYSIHRTDSVMTIRLPVVKNSRIQAEGLNMTNDMIRLGSLSINTSSATLLKRSGEMIGVDTGEVDVNLSNLQLEKKDGKFAWTALVNTLHLKNPNSFILGKNNKLQLNEASVGNLNLSSGYINDFNSLIRYNISAWLRTTTGQYSDSMTTFKWNNAEYDFAKKVITLDSFVYHPTQSRDSVMATTPFQRDYITFHSGKVRLTGFNLERYKIDSSFIADSMLIMNPAITIYRDKQPPYLPGTDKPLPVDLLRKIDIPVTVNKLKLIDGFLSYTEKNAKTRAEGTLFFTYMNAEISNIKNQNFNDKDSLLLTMNAYLMDSAMLRLSVKESYNDTLSGFLMTLKMTPTSLSLLNPVLVPMSNVKITSGIIDSFDLRAIGHNNLSIGEMRMYYRGLRIRLVKDGDEVKSSLMNKVVSFLANTFLIKKNNKGRAGIVYFERVKDRSFFNYIVKMTFSGMATSIGVKKNRKYLKQYKRELRQRNLPPIDFK